MPPVAEEEAKVEQVVEVGGMEERIMEVKKEAEVEQEVQISAVEKQFVVVKDEADEVEEELGGSLRGGDEAGFIDRQERVSTTACKETARLLAEGVNTERK